MAYNNKKVAFLFPGQGAQYIGMADDFVAQNEAFAAVLKKFDADHNTDLAKIIKDGPEDLLKETKFTQPAILFHSIAALNTFLEKIDIEPDFVAGHSLGEFSALVANGTLSWLDAMHLVHKRGEFMIKANSGTPFAMTAIVGLAPEKVKELCETASQTGVVIAANFNTPVQTVISGSEDGVAKAEELCKAAGAKRIIRLNVGGPFHSPLIKKAEGWLNEEISKLEFCAPDCPVVSNVDAEPTADTQKIKDNLCTQVTHSVLWVDSVKRLLDEGVELFIEFGPNKVLAGMMKKIDRKAKILSIDKLADIDKVAEALEAL